MSYIFEIEDKTGRKIRMPKKQWTHIMRKHSYLEKYLDEMKETLVSPDRIINHQNGKAHYYKHYKNLKSPNKFVFVAVKYLNGEGFIITVYLEDKIT